MRDMVRKTGHNNLFRQQYLTLSTEVHHIRPRSSEANWKSRELSRNPLYTPGRKINRVQTQPRICTNRHRFGFKITHSIHKHLREQKNDINQRRNHTYNNPQKSNFHFLLTPGSGLFSARGYNRKPLEFIAKLAKLGRVTMYHQPFLFFLREVVQAACPPDMGAGALLRGRTTISTAATFTSLPNIILLPAGRAALCFSLIITS